MSISEESLRATYRGLPDAKLMRLATQDAAQLRPEALALLRAELEARGLTSVAAPSIAAQLRVLSEAELTGYGQLLRAQPCPRCQSLAQPLSATITRKVLSILVLTTVKEEFAIACPSCLRRQHRDADVYSAVLGWWGIPWGIIRTIQALVANAKRARGIEATAPNDLLRAFVAQNVGRIEAARNDAAALQTLIRVPRW